MSTLQSFTLRELEKAGHYVINVTAASKNGVPDIVGCTTKGKFFAVEIKEKGDVLSDLQIHNIYLIVTNGGVAVVIKSQNDVEELINITLKE